MARNTNLLGKTVWATLANGAASYGSLFVACPCADCATRANGPRVLFRNDDALALFVLANDTTDASVRSIVRRATTRSAMRHIVAGHDDALFLGCAIANNRAQQNDDAPIVGTMTYALTDIDRAMVRDDDARTARDERARE